MAFYFANLDLKTREYMIREIDLDASSGRLYLSPRLRPGSEHEYASYLRAAARAHNEAWMAEQIRRRRLLKTEEQRMTSRNEMLTMRVPVTAPYTLAEIEFNRFYARGVCARAIDAGMSEVELYRGKHVPQLPPESEAMIGKRVPADTLLQILRTAEGAESVPGLAAEPVPGLAIEALSGVTVRLVS
ncbi:MAG: hypothetical protein ACSLFQ_03980 [Thermoanaerobaculia bacterium]